MLYAASPVYCSRNVMGDGPLSAAGPCDRSCGPDTVPASDGAATSSACAEKPIQFVVIVRQTANQEDFAFTTAQPSANEVRDV
jgi:hypothetical protein